MTDPDPIAPSNERKHCRPAPAASLTRVSIRGATQPRPPDEREEVVHVYGTSPVIEAQAAVIADNSNPSLRRGFPAANTRAPTHASRDSAPRCIGQDSDIAPSAIIDLWEHLAADRLRPDISDFDPITIAGHWPNSLLLRVSERGRRPGLEVAHMFAPPAGGLTSAIPIDAMTVDWIVGLGREVVITGGPVHETDAVPTSSGSTSCGVIALPFGAETSVDHVLCHLYRIDEGVLEGETDPELSHPPRDRTGIKRLFGR
mgnify:FL=1